MIFVSIYKIISNYLILYWIIIYYIDYYYSILYRLLLFDIISNNLITLSYKIPNLTESSSVLYWSHYQVKHWLYLFSAFFLLIQPVCSFLLHLLWQLSTSCWYFLNSLWHRLNKVLWKHSSEISIHIGTMTSTICMLQQKSRLQP